MTRPLVVIGGSAGALDALLALVASLPAAIPPIVIVLHVASQPHSLLPELIGRATTRRVFEIEDKMPLEPDTVYVAPADYHVLVERDGTLALSIDPPVLFSRPSIDALFESAAVACGRGAIAIVLSGANHDGAAGLAAIVREGGVAIVHDPLRAALPTMPAAALDRAGAGTRVLDIPEMAALLARGAIA